MKNIPYKIAETKQNFTSRAGLLVVAELMQRLGLVELANRLMPLPGSNRGYLPGTLFQTFMLMLHEGARCLDDVRELHHEKPLMKLLGLKRIPSARTLGNVLRRMGRSQPAQQAFVELNKRVLSAALYRKKNVTLDIDASVIESHKREAKWSYKKHPGYTPMIGHIAESGQVVAIDFRDGNVAPATANLEFTRQCEAALPEGVKVSHFRADAASYQAQLINHLMAHDIGFAIRAKMDVAVKAVVADIPESDWHPLQERNGNESTTREVSRTVHTMNETKHAFVLVAERVLLEEEEQQQLELFVDCDHNHAVRGRYLYRAIATNLDQQQYRDSQIVHCYNQRGEPSENRIKELVSDFAGGQLPCGDFKANATWWQLNMIAYNLLALLRQVLPLRWSRDRAGTLRWRLYGIAGKIVHHARQWTLKINSNPHLKIEWVRCQIRHFPLLS